MSARTAESEDYHKHVTAFKIKELATATQECLQIYTNIDDNIEVALWERT